MNLRERQNEDNIYTNYDGLEDLVLVENWGLDEGGDEPLWLQFVDFYSSPVHSYEQWEAQTDVEEYLNYMIPSIVFVNKDFPSNNMICWRPTASDGRWRWIMKDLDAGLGFLPYDTPDSKYLRWLDDPLYCPNPEDTRTGNIEGATCLWRNLMACPQAREAFLDRICVYLGDHLSCDRFAALCDTMAAQIQPELTFARRLYDVDWDWTQPSVLVPQAKEWYRQRIGYMYQELGEWAQRGDTMRAVPLRILAPTTCAIPAISVNGLRLHNAVFDGRWLDGRPLTVTAVEASGEAPIKYWIVKLTKGTTHDTWVSPGSELKDFVIPAGADTVTLTPAADLSGIDDATKSTSQCHSMYYDLMGRQLGPERPTLPGIYVHSQGSVNHKIKVQ